MPLRTQRRVRRCVRGRSRSSRPASRSRCRASATRCSSSTRTSRARARARRAERRFGAVLEATSDWVSIADRRQEPRLHQLRRPADGRHRPRRGHHRPARSASSRRAWARELVLSEALPVARREGVWRGDLARLHRDGHEIPVSQVIVARTDAGRRGRLLRHDRARHDARARRRGRAARERGALPDRVRAGADRRSRCSTSTGASCRSTTRTAGRCGARARSSSGSARWRSRTPTTSPIRAHAMRAAHRAARCRSTASRSATSIPPARRSGSEISGASSATPRGNRSTSSGWCRTSASAASRTRCSAAC